MKKLTKVLLLSLVLILIFGAVSASAYDAYDTRQIVIRKDRLI